MAPEHMLRRMSALAALVIGTASVVAGLAYLGQRSLIYLPDRDVPPPPDDVTVVEFSSEDGIEHRGWLLQPEGAPIATVLVFNGNAGDKADRLPLARALSAEGMEVLLFDYRGYGETAGSPSEEGLLADARAAREALSGRDTVLYLGESLGAAVAVALAVERPPDGLVLRSPFTSLVDVARIHYGPVPRWLLRDRWPVLGRVDEIEVPVLVVAGRRDTMVPFEQSEAVAEAVGAEAVTIDVGHNHPLLSSGPRLVEAVADFARRVSG